MKTSIRFRYAACVENGEIVPDFIYQITPGMTSCIGFWKPIQDADFRSQCGTAIMIAAEKKGVKIK